MRKQAEARERQRKKERKEKEKKAKEDERAYRKRKEEEDKLAPASDAALPSQKKGQPRASRLPCNVLSGLAYARATARATARDLRPHITPPPQNRHRVLFLAQLVAVAGGVLIFGGGSYCV